MQLSLPLLLLLLVLAHADRGRPGRRGRHGQVHQRRAGRNQRFQATRQQPRRGRQGGNEAVPGGVDFSNCEDDGNGMCCVYKETTVQSIQKEPVLECNHKNIEKCHYTYVTQFEPVQEEKCEENFEKSCQITFKQVATQETVQKCLTPLRKVCGDGNGNGAAQPQYGQGQAQYGGGNGNGGNGGVNGGGSGSGGAGEECRTFYESSCTTRYIEKQPGKFVGDTSCEKQPVELCGQGCRMEQGEPECHDKAITSLLDVPEEVCDLNPQKTCRFVTRLVPRLKPEHECTIIPQEICNLKFSAPKQVDKPLKTKWCIDPSAGVEKDEGGYDEGNAQAAPIGYNAGEGNGQAAPAPIGYSAAESAPPVYSQPAPSAPASYAQPIAPPPPAPTSYAQPAPSGYNEPSGGDYEYEYEYDYDDLDTRNSFEPASNSYAQPQSPPPSSYAQAAQPATDSYSQPPSSYAQPAEAPSSYAQPAEAPSSYAQPAEAPSSYAQPEPALPSYSQPAPAPSSYSQPAAPVYSQPQPAPAPTSYSEPAPSSYSEPATNSYSQPPQPALPTYSSNTGPKPTPGPVYYKPVSEPELPVYGRRYYRSSNKL